MRYVRTLHEEGGLLVALRPGDLLALVLHATDATADGIVIRAIDHRLCVVHQFKLLHTLLFHRTEILLMGCTQRGKHADGGLDDVAQGKHLTRLTDTGLKDTHLGLLVQQPYRERHADLRVIAARRTDNLL